MNTKESEEVIALHALSVPPRTKKSIYPEIFALRMEGREKRVVGDLFGLLNFGVNVTTLQPGAASALRHSHSKQDEFIYVLQGTPTLYHNGGATQLDAGMCAGFKAGNGNAHCLKNESDEVVVYLEVGDRSPGDAVFYPDDDLRANFIEGAWQFSHKDGTPY